MSHARPNIHPGEILREEFLKAGKVDLDILASALELPRWRLDELIAGRDAVCADTALRLSTYFGTSERFWLEIQLCYDLERARRRRSLAQSDRYATPSAA